MTDEAVTRFTGLAEAVQLGNEERAYFDDLQQQLNARAPVWLRFEIRPRLQIYQAGVPAVAEIRIVRPAETDKHGTVVMLYPYQDSAELDFVTSGRKTSTVDTVTVHSLATGKLADAVVALVLRHIEEPRERTRAYGTPTVSEAPKPKQEFDTAGGKCMKRGCTAPATHKAKWAEGAAFVRFCDKHWDVWSKEHKPGTGDDYFDHQKIEADEQTEFRRLAGQTLDEFVANDIVYLRKYLTMSDKEKMTELMERFPYEAFDYIEGVNPDALAEKGIGDGSEMEQYAERMLPFTPDDWPGVNLEDFASRLLSGSDPANVPTWAHMSFEQIVKNQWLVHFSDAAGNIAGEGFTRGMGDLARLGLTTYFSDRELKHGGYNFAFTPGDALRFGRVRSGKAQYGKEAIMFRASGAQVHHWGDEENQVIVWGETARDLVYLQSNDGLEFYVAQPGTNKEFVRGDLKKVMSWVEANYAQYRKQVGNRQPGGVKYRGLGRLY